MEHEALNASGGAVIIAKSLLASGNITRPINRAIKQKRSHEKEKE